MLERDLAIILPPELLLPLESYASVVLLSASDKLEVPEDWARTDDSAKHKKN